MVVFAETYLSNPMTKFNNLFFKWLGNTRQTQKHKEQKILHSVSLKKVMSKNVEASKLFTHREKQKNFEIFEIFEIFGSRREYS